MPPVFPPLLLVQPVRLGGIQDQQVLSTALFGSGGEVEAACHQGPSIKHHHLVMSDGVARAQIDRGAGVRQRQPVRNSWCGASA